MYQPLAVAIITFTITVLGTIANVLVFVSALRMGSMSSSFGTITKNQAICNTIMCLIFLTYVCPMQLSDDATLIKYSHILGLVAMSIYEVSNLLHLLIAVNRFCAVFLSFYYEKLFSRLGTIIMIQVVWVFSFIMCSIFYEFIGCFFSYDDISWTFGFLSTPKCIQLTWYTDFALNTTLIVTTLFINLLTAFKAGKNSRMLMNAAGIQMSQRQKQREMGFIKQTFFQGISIFAGQFTYYLIAPLLTNPILLFLVASLWAFMHAVEGAIIFASNKEMQEVLKKRKNTFIQVFMSCNRFYSLFFPFGIQLFRGIPVTNWAIVFSVIVNTCLSALTFPEGCAYVYDPNHFVWRGEDHPCAHRIAVFIPPIVFTATIVSNGFNIATASRLIMEKMIGMSRTESRNRRKRWMIMFTQSVIQDCLQLIDTINSYYIWKLYDAIWFQFLFVTLSFLTVTALDGLVMFICNSDCHPNWMKSSKRNNLVLNIAIPSRRMSATVVP